jgi:hypothetical protein
MGAILLLHGVWLGGWPLSDDPEQPQEAPIPLDAFIASLRPQQIGTRLMQPRRQGNRTLPAYEAPIFSPGSDDHIWGKLLRIRHGNERHTTTEWNALIDKMREEPAHPSHPDFASVN